MFDLLNTCGTSDAVKKCRQQCKYFGVRETDTVRVDFNKIVEAIWNNEPAASGAEGAGDADGHRHFEQELRRSRQDYEDRRSRENVHDFGLARVSRQHSSDVHSKKELQNEQIVGIDDVALAREQEEQRRFEEEERRRLLEEEKRRELEEATRREQEEQERVQREREEAQRREEEQRRAEEEEEEENDRRAEERRRRAQEVQAALQAEQDRREAQELERQREEEDQKKRLLEVREALQAEQARQEETAKRKDQEMCLDQVSKREKLRLFLENGGFKSVNEKKKQIGSLKATSFASMAPQFTYPLHTAVRAKDVAAVEALLWGGVDPSLLDSNKLTALALAQKLNKKGSHAEVIAALTS